MVSHFLTIKIKVVKNCYTRSWTLTDSLVRRRNALPNTIPNYWYRIIDLLLEHPAFHSMSPTPVWAVRIQVC
jgi:hypothetical protein